MLTSKPFFIVVAQHFTERLKQLWKGIHKKISWPLASTPNNSHVASRIYNKQCSVDLSLVYQTIYRWPHISRTNIIQVASWLYTKQWTGFILHVTKQYLGGLLPVHQTIVRWPQSWIPHNDLVDISLYTIQRWGGIFLKHKTMVWWPFASTPNSGLIASCLYTKQWSGGLAPVHQTMVRWSLASAPCLSDIKCSQLKPIKSVLCVPS